MNISLQNGLQHYRNNRLVNAYKIIPDTIKRKQVINCSMPPCPPLQLTEPAFYMENIKSYIMLTDLTDKNYFKAAPAGYNARISKPLTEEQIAIWYILKKIKQLQ